MDRRSWHLRSDRSGWKYTSTGIYLNPDADASIIGNSNYINLTTNTDLTIAGDGSTIVGGQYNDIFVDGGDYNSISVGASNVITVDDGQFNNVASGDHSDINVMGSDFNDITGGSDSWISVDDGQFNDIFDPYMDTVLEFYGNTLGDTIGGAPVFFQTDSWAYFWMYDPLILNLHGGAVDTQGLGDSVAMFDMQNVGTPVRTGWVTAGEGLLVVNSDGSDAPITMMSQLLPGFESLHALDSDNNGLLDGNDSGWRTLWVWTDTNGTGDFSSGDYCSLDELGIISIDLNATAASIASHGNIITNQSTFTWTTGQSGAIASVDLAFVPILPDAPSSGPVAGEASARTLDLATLRQAVEINLELGALYVAGDAHHGLSGIEVVEGTAYDDRIIGGSKGEVLQGGGGADRLTGGGGSDRFVYVDAEDGGDTITDFASGAGGDVLDIKQLLIGYDASASNLEDFVRISSDESDAVLSVSVDGSGRGFVDLAVLQGQAGLMLGDLLDKGNLVIA